MKKLLHESTRPRNETRRRQAALDKRHCIIAQLSTDVVEPHTEDGYESPAVVTIRFLDGRSVKIRVAEDLHRSLHMDIDVSEFEGEPQISFDRINL